MKEFYLRNGYEAESIDEGQSAIKTTVSTLVKKFDEALYTSRSGTKTTVALKNVSTPNVAGKRIIGDKENWLVSKRMRDLKDDDISSGNNVHEGDIFAEFACDAGGGYDEWMERPLSLAVIPPKALAADTTRPSISTVTPTVHWHAPVDYKFDMFSADNHRTADKPADVWPSGGYTNKTVSSSASVAGKWSIPSSRKQSLILTAAARASSFEQKCCTSNDNLKWGQRQATCVPMPTSTASNSKVLIEDQKQ